MTQKQTGARPRKGNVAGIYKFGYAIVRPIVNALSRPRWEGVENLPGEGAFILAPNHLSNFDPVSMGYFMADNGYEVRFLAKDSLFRVPVIGPFMKRWGMIPVVRQSAEANDSLRYAREALEKGDVVGIYCEGTLTRDPAFWPMRAKTGLARLALDTQVPVIPVAQWGAQSIMDRYSPLSLKAHRPHLVIRVLPALDYSDIQGDSSNHEGVRELTARLEVALTDGVAHIRGEQPPETMWDPRQHERLSRVSLKPLSRWRKKLRRVNGRQDILPADLSPRP